MQLRAGAQQAIGRFGTRIDHMLAVVQNQQELFTGKMVNYGGPGTCDEGTFTFEYPKRLPEDSFGLRGRWALDYQGATAAGPDSAIRLDYHARNVYLVVGGTGTVTVTRGGESRRIAVEGPPTLRQLVGDDDIRRGALEVQLSQGLQAFSFTYG